MEYIDVIFMYSKRAKYILKQMNDVVMYIVHVLLCDRILILGTFLKSIDKKPIGTYLWQVGNKKKLPFFVQYFWKEKKL